MHPRGLDWGPGHKLCQQAGNPPLTRKIHCQNHLIVFEFDHSKDSLYCKLFVTSTLDMIMDWFSQLNTCIYAFEVVVKQFNVLTVTVYKKSSVHDKKKIQDIQGWQNLYNFIVFILCLHVIEDLWYTFWVQWSLHVENIYFTTTAIYISKDLSNALITVHILIFFPDY